MSIVITPGSAAAGLPGLGVTDPQNLQWIFYHGNGFQINVQGASVASQKNSTNNGFWDQVDRMGNYVTSMTNSTYFTIVDITGSKAGYVTAVIGPMADVNKIFTTTIKFTIDGTETIVAHDPVKTASNQPSRALLGIAETETVIGIDNSAQTDAIYAQGSLPQIVDPYSAFTNGHPYVNFNESLKIEIQCDNLDTSNSTARYAGATWRYYD